MSSKLDFSDGDFSGAAGRPTRLCGTCYPGDLPRSAGVVDGNYGRDASRWAKSGQWTK